MSYLITKTNTIVYKSESDIYNDSAALANKLQKYQFKNIISVANSGNIVSAVVGKILGIKYTPIYTGSGVDIIYPSVVPEVTDSVVIDDSIYTCTRLKILQEHIFRRKFKFACLYTRHDNKHIPIEYVEEINKRRIFYYNLFKNKSISYAILDLDGVICQDPVNHDSTPEYRKELESLGLVNSPRFPPVAILTNRLEAHRKVTEEWLKKNNVKYKMLLMAPSRESRIDNKFKISEIQKLQKTHNPLFYVDNDGKRGRQASSVIDTIIYGEKHER